MACYSWLLFSTRLNFCFQDRIGTLDFICMECQDAYRVRGMSGAFYYACYFSDIVRLLVCQDRRIVINFFRVLLDLDLRLFLSLRRIFRLFLSSFYGSDEGEIFLLRRFLMFLTRFFLESLWILSRLFIRYLWLELYFNVFQRNQGGFRHVSIARFGVLYGCTRQRCWRRWGYGFFGRDFVVCLGSCFWIVKYGYVGLV